MREKKKVMFAMGEARKLYPMVPIIRVFSVWERSTGKEGRHGQTDECTMGAGKRTKWMEMENSLGRMDGLMRALGCRIEWMALVL